MEQLQKGQKPTCCKNIFMHFFLPHVMYYLIGESKDTTPG